MKKLLLAAPVALAACAQTPGPSVPAQTGQNLQTARAAVAACVPAAERAGQNYVVGNYVGSVLWGGIVLGPVIIASNESTIRRTGEVNGVDRCLEKRGFQRRDLTAEEMRALNSASPGNRHFILDHLIGGGTLASLRTSGN